MEFVTVYRPEVKDEELEMSDETIDLPKDRVERIFHDISPSILKHFLAGFVKFPGFRNPHRVPRPILFKKLTGDMPPHLLSAILWGSMEELLLELGGAKVRDVRRDVDEYVARHGADVLHVALLIQPRKGLRRLAESLPAGPPPASDPSEGAPSAAASIPEGASPASPPEATAVSGEGGETSSDGDAQSGGDDPSGDVHANCLRTIRRLERDIDQRDNLIQRERRKNGKLGEEIGNLRERLQQREQELAALRAKHERLQARAAAYEEQAATQTRLAEWEAELQARDAVLRRFFGDDGQRLTESALAAGAKIHDLEAMHTLLGMALAEAQKRRQDALDDAPMRDEIPLARCIDAVKAHIEGCGQKAAATATDETQSLAARREAAETLQRHLAAVEHLNGLKPGDATVALDAQSTAVNRLIDGLRAAEEIEFSLEGTVFYEGPYAWLRTEDHAFGLPGQFTDEAQLVTGDRVELHFSHSPEDPFAWDAEVLERVERQEVNDSLRLDEGGFWVQTPEGDRLDVSFEEVLRSGIRPDSPVQVQAPPVPLGATEPTYVRLAKALPMPHVRRPALGAARRARRLARTGAPQERLPNVLQGQHVLIVGGDGLQRDYLDTVQRMGGRVVWQSGFAEFARVGDRAAKADVVIIATGRTSHAVANEAAAAARRAARQIAYFHALGRSSFLRFLLHTFGDEPEAEAAG